MVNTLPPPEKVQQLMRIRSQRRVGQTAKGLIIEVLVDPFDLTAGGLLDNAIATARMVARELGNYAEGHHCAASNKDWNRRASPPWRKKLFGSWPSGSDTVRTFKPCSPSRQARDCAACWPLRLASASKAR